MDGDNLFISDIIKRDNFSFADNTTYRCGGRARAAYYPKTISQATAVYDYLKSKNEKFTVLGNGSNVLAADGGFDGAVICTRNLCGIKNNGDSLFCLAGTTVGELLNYCKNNSCGGLEYLAGIPATVGGLAYMNGGAANHYISQNIVNVLFYDRSITKISNKNCNFGYKYSIMRDINGLILGVELSFTKSSREQIIKNVAKFLQARRNQPKGASCGCVFKNPPNISAGKIIDECGLKGLREGGAYVSCAHANFIVNDGGSSADVKKLIDIVKSKVFKRTCILLEEEVVYIGDF